MNSKQLRKYLPTILTILGGGGVLATGYFSAKAGASIKDIALDETKSKDEKKKEIIKEAAPACLSAFATIGCIVSSNIIGEKNLNNIRTELGAGYVLLQNGYNQYRKHIDQEIHERAIKKISEEKIKTVTVPVYVEGKYPWCDMYHKDPWYATEGDVFFAEIRVKELISNTCSASLHDFYEVLRKERGCDVPYVPMEEDLIWDADILSHEWDTCEVTFSNLYDIMEDGSRLYTLDFLMPLYTSDEIKKIEKEIYGE